MKQTRPYARVTVTPKGARWSESGHPLGIRYRCGKDGRAPPGRRPDGCGDWKRAVSGHWILQFRSKIRVRLLSRNANDRFDDAFFQRRFRYAWDYRKAVMRPQDLTCCRVIFGEARTASRTTVDRFGDILVTQTLSLGMEQRKKPAVPPALPGSAGGWAGYPGCLRAHDVPRGSGRGWRRTRAFPGWEGDGTTATAITENGVSYYVDVENGQKTGFFLDQKFNREAVARLAPRKEGVGLLHPYRLFFALNAVRGGAEQVCAVDISDTAVQQAQANARLNGWEERMEFRCANVFDWLPQLEAEGKRPFDFIILDPPAFTKSRRTVESAARGYKGDQPAGYAPVAPGRVLGYLLLLPTL